LIFACSVIIWSTQMATVTSPPRGEPAPSYNTPVERSSLLDAMQGIMDASIGRAARSQTFESRVDAQVYGRNVAATLPADKFLLLYETFQATDGAARYTVTVPFDVQPGNERDNMDFALEQIGNIGSSVTPLEIFRGARY
jgi:hypothetical protein